MTYLLKLLVLGLLVIQVGCQAEEEEEVEGEALPDGSGVCASSEAEPKSSDGYLKLKISGDYSGDVTYTCYKIPSLRDGDNTDDNSIREDIGVNFFDNGEGGAYTDTVQVAFSMFQGFYEGLKSFRFCPLQTDDTHGSAGGAIKIRTGKLSNPDATATTYDVWLQMRCDGDTEHLLTIDSHDTAARQVTGHFSDVPFRTDDKTKSVSASASFSFFYEETE